MFCLITMLVVLPAWALLAQAGETAASKPDANAEVPWSKEVDGLACRIIVPQEGAIGLSVPIIVEIKNVSDRRRYIKDLGIDDMHAKQQARIGVKLAVRRPV
jgi:hypothetical protein